MRGRMPEGAAQEYRVARLFRLVVLPVLMAAMTATLAAAGLAEQLCIGQDVAPGPDGRMLGHIPYVEAAPATLVNAPASFAYGPPCRVNQDMAPDLVRMLNAARQALGTSGRLLGISCYRSIAHQRAVFCSQIGPGKRCADAAERARAVGPPGYSEHHTGYAIDFVTRPSRGCSDVDACFAETPAGKWLIAHAPDYGFELSFPPGNAQGVTWEPWHWRWVGATAATPGADKARALFARARAEFPAQPTTPDSAPPKTTEAPAPSPAPTPPKFGPPPP